MTDLLVCTLGASWPVIPEIYGFLAPDRLPLYAAHPKATELEAQRREFGLKPPAEIWICTTQGARAEKGIDALRNWAAQLSHPVTVRVWQAEGTNQLATAEECHRMRELTLRVVLLAHTQAAGGQVTLSLAGGRKTMSADLQWAGDRFGCDAVLHVVTSEPLPDALNDNKNPEIAALLSRSLPVDLAATVFPLVVGRGRRSELLDVDYDSHGPVTIARFPLPLAELHCIWQPPSEAAPTLEAEIIARENAGSQLFGNFLQALGANEHHENWRSLYRLPPRSIDVLRQTPLAPAHRAWLHRLPKADLHRHIGGCLDLDAQRTVGRAIWDDLTVHERAAALETIAPLLRQAEWSLDWPEHLKRSASRAAATAALLVEASDDQLHHNLYRVTEPRIALKSRHELGFAAYERPGELSGSALLVHPAAIPAYAKALVAQALSEGLAYVELRGSPHKYDRGDGLRFLRALEAALREALAAVAPAPVLPEFRFNLIADRRERDRVGEVVELAVRAREALPDFVAGIDLAGDEGTQRPEELAPFFLPAFRACLPVTIHAGEGEPAESIWEAAYHLHADRIGHGLTISAKPELAQRFRDRGICLELCPTSNREVVGFRDPAHPETQDCDAYPLIALWQSGQPLTLCTDNPGISRTTLTDEYLTAQRMTNGALTLWDTLAMLKQAFTHAFLPAETKQRFIKSADTAIYQQLAEDPA